MDKKQNKFYVHMFIIAALLFLFVFAWDKISFLFDVSGPVLLGVVIAYLADGMVRFFNARLKIPRLLSIALVVVLILVLGGLLVYYTIPFLVETVKDLVALISSLLSQHNSGIYEIINSVAKYLNIDVESIYNFDFTKLDNRILELFNKIISGASGMVVNRITSIGSSLVSIITAIMLAVYMLIEKDDLINRGKRFVRAISPAKYEEKVMDAFTMANTVFKKFIIGKFIDSAIIGVLMYILFKLFRIDYAAVFSIIGGVGNMIPYFGPIFGAIPVVIILLIIDPLKALVALIIILVVQQLDGNVIGPKILSDNIGVSAFWILLAVTVCGMAFGFSGMIFGVPLVVVIKNLVEDFVDARLKARSPVEVLAGDTADVALAEACESADDHISVDKPSDEEELDDKALNEEPSCEEKE